MSTQKAYAITLTAATGADLTKNRYINVGASGLAAPSDVSEAVGVLLENYDDSENTEGNETTAKAVAIEGIVEVEASAAIAVGAAVATGADGRAKTAVSTNVVLGRCVKAAGGAGEFASVLLIRGAGALA